MTNAPMVSALSDKFEIEAFQFHIEDVPMASGQLSIYTAPTIMLYYKGSEYHRQSRIIDFRQLEYRINQITNAISKY